MATAGQGTDWRSAALLPPSRVRIPLGSVSAEEGFAELAALLGVESGLEATGPDRGGELRPEQFRSPSGATRIRILRVPGGEHDPPSMALGVAPASPTGHGEDDEARVLVLLRSGSLAEAAVEDLRQTLFRQDVEAAVLEAGSPAAVRRLLRLREPESTGTLLVRDVMQPLSYRIYPDTPIHEVIELIARRHLEAVPVVDQRLQVLGVISAASALEHALRRRGKGREEPGPTVREVMTRSVLCVGEDESLLKAAQLMSKREAAQLPVVREGEMVGFLTRDGVLSVLLGRGPLAPADHSTTDQTSRDSKK
ncbi:MAG: CBS domain-containing protein [Gemmatimonadota bacterium]